MRPFILNYKLIENIISFLSIHTQSIPLYAYYLDILPLLCETIQTQQIAD